MDRLAGLEQVIRPEEIEQALQAAGRVNARDSAGEPDVGQNGAIHILELVEVLDFTAVSGHTDGSLQRKIRRIQEVQVA